MLVVDDEPQILRALQTNLRGAGYEVQTAATVAEALARRGDHPPDAVILDLVLPDGSGTDVCRELRTWSSMPIVVLSAVGDEQEKVAALDAGADDYVTKPFGMEELLARLRAALRRSSAGGEPVLKVGELVLDLEKHVVLRNGYPLSLTPTEYDLLALLIRNEGKLLTHPAILREVWGPAYGDESHYLHVYVSQLRRKIEPDPTRPRYLLTEAGAGYRLVSPERRILRLSLGARPLASVRGGRAVVHPGAAPRRYGGRGTSSRTASSASSARRRSSRPPTATSARRSTTRSA